MARRKVLAAGGVVYRDGRGGTGPQFLLVHRDRYHDWSMPKGKLDRGETFKEAAAREVFEETGLECSVKQYLGAVTYPTQRGRPKLVRYWLLKAKKGDFVPNLEVDEAEWVGINGARALLTYNRDARLLERADALLADPTSTRLYVVRHGNAGVGSKKKGADKKRQLTARGVEQAASVADFMARHPVTNIISSPALRCVQMVEPLAARLDMEVATSKRLKETATLDEILAYVAKLDGSASVLATHENWIGPLVQHLDKQGVRLRGARRWPKASIWVFDVVGGEISAGYYAGRGSVAPT